jgi:predicted kinase
MQAVIFTGIQASGKTTFYCDRFFETHIRISLDMLHTRNREQILLRACLEAKQPFVIDNTNVLAAERARYIVPAKKAGFRVTGYYFLTELRGAIWRNNRRLDKRSIPVKGLVGTLKRMQPPSIAEGYDEIYSVRLGSQNRFEVEPWLPASNESKMDFTDDCLSSGGFMEKTQLPVTCPICGRKNSFRVEELTEGATLVCPFCKVKLTLHGHMWEDIQRELQKTKEGP